MILFKDGKILCESDSISQKLTLGAGQKLELTLVCQGSGDAVFDVDVAGEGAEIVLKGLYLCKDQDSLHVKVNMTHSVGSGTSLQVFKGVVSGRARTSFDGKIVVAPDAQKTEAYQTNRNLLLSDDAVVETTPQLEIYADDVKCSHGATCGSLDEDARFYMRSRGISDEQARRLQIISFISEVLDTVPEDYKELIYSQI